jgi:hypothetical protein
VLRTVYLHSGWVYQSPLQRLIIVAWGKRSKRWRTSKSEGKRLLFYAAGRDFEKVMKKTLSVGLQFDEPAE